jgi:hypothetical protein
MEFGRRNIILIIIGVNMIQKIKTGILNQLITEFRIPSSIVAE